MRLSDQDSYEEGIIKLSEGNPGAMTVLVKSIVACVARDGVERGPILAGMVFYALDVKEVYGEAIWILFKDTCGQDIDVFIDKTLEAPAGGVEGVLRALLGGGTDG